MTRFLKTKRNYLSRQKERTPLTQGFSLFSLNIIVLVLVVLLGFVYILLINSTATGGFTIKELSNRIAALEEESKKLELTLAEQQSMKNIQAGTKDLNLVSISQMEYLEPAGAVAVERR